MKVLVGGEKEQSVIPPPITHNAPTPRHNHRRSLAIFFIGFCLFLTCKSWSCTHETLRNPAYLIEAQHGAVASENERCSNIGILFLRKEERCRCSDKHNTMRWSGIGGGGFMTVRIPPAHANASSEVFNIDFREMAPSASYPDMYPPGTDTSRFGGLSVAVPGELRGLEEAHKRWGTLPWKRLVQPAVDLAAGWEVDVELGKRIPWFHELMLGNPDWSSIFAPRGVLLKEGEPIKRTNYSRTLATIAEEGADAFYKGPIADAIIRKITSTGGIMTHADLENYKVRVDRALEGTYRGRKVYTTHAPTSGPVLLHMLNLMEKYELEERNGINVHRIIEAMRFGFASRTRICDPTYQNNTHVIQQMSTKAFADTIFLNITDETHPPDYYNPEYDIQTDHGTMHISILDSSGMAVAITSTVNLVFGSQVLDPETGIIFNDEMDDFSVPGTPNGFGLWPSPYNYPEPGKRSLSSTVPTIIENADGSFYLAVGGSGGSRIFPAVFQVILNLDWDMNISDAIEYGRLHDQLYPLFMDADSVYPKEILKDLVARGHNVTVADVNRVAAVIQGVMMKDGKIFAASDSRKNGVAAGY
ncbi:gamma-glutamyltranspeptidase [Mucidula mucida]|nr:gamma-glutamyltranspeptidase [Mucidula mucida]